MADPSVTRRRALGGALASAAVYFTPARRAFGQAAAPAADPSIAPQTIPTGDELELRGVWHKSKSGGGTAPVVILIHGSGDDPNKGGFRELATLLAEKGFHALRFDLRGHGQSTVIGNVNQFWQDPINQRYMPAQARRKKPKLELADFKGKTDYYARFADDIMGARVMLDRLNDANLVNTSSVYLIGARDAVAYGFLYLTAEWSRPQVLPRTVLQCPPLVPPGTAGSILLPGLVSAGRDVAGAIWLSPERTPAVPNSALQKFIQYAPEIRERTPMLFLHGAEDSSGKQVSNYYLKEVLAARVPGVTLAPLPNTTQAMAVEKTKLVGAELLGKNLGVEKLIVQYLEALETARRNPPPLPGRSYSIPPAINLPLFGVMK